MRRTASIACSPRTPAITKSSRQIISLFDRRGRVVCHRQRQVDEAKRLCVAIRTRRPRRSAGRTVRIRQRPGVERRRATLVHGRERQRLRLRFEIGADGRLREPEMYADTSADFPTGWRSTSMAICTSAVTRPTRSGESAPIGRRRSWPTTAGAFCSAGRRTWPSAAKTSTKSMSPTSAGKRSPARNWEFAASRWRTCE